MNKILNQKENVKETNITKILNQKIKSQEDE